MVVRAIVTVVVVGLLFVGLFGSQVFAERPPIGEWRPERIYGDPDWVDSGKPRGEWQARISGAHVHEMERQLDFFLAWRYLTTREPAKGPERPSECMAELLLGARPCRMDFLGDTLVVR